LTGWLLSRYLDQGLGLGGRIALAAANALFACLSLFGFLGLFLRLFKKEIPALRYLADASYWIYIVHLPLVGLMQILLTPVPFPAAVKFALTLSSAVLFSLWSYQRWVRFTFIGVVLNGARPRAETAPHAIRSAAA
jgi:peptidoglycan/LPS O-acetylase OafA/YrhL